MILKEQELNFSFNEGDQLINMGIEGNESFAASEDDSSDEEIEPRQIEVQEGHGRSTQDRDEERAVVRQRKRDRLIGGSLESP